MQKKQKMLFRKTEVEAIVTCQPHLLRGAASVLGLERRGEHTQRPGAQKALVSSGAPRLTHKWEGAGSWQQRELIPESGQ